MSMITGTAAIVLGSLLISTVTSAQTRFQTQGRIPDNPRAGTLFRATGAGTLEPAIGATQLGDTTAQRIPCPNGHDRLQGVAVVDGIHQYDFTMVRPGVCKWIKNTEVEKENTRRNQHKAELFRALTHRVLSPKELKEAAAYGNELNIYPDQPFHADDADDQTHQLQTAWIIQQTFQAAVPCR